MSDSPGDGPNGPSPEIAALVRRDVRVFAYGSFAAVAMLALLGLGGAGVVDEVWSDKIAVVVGLLVAAGAVAWWLVGPAELRRHRYMVLAPASLSALPVLIGLQRLGGGGVAVALSAAFGIGAAIALGLAYAARRRR